MSCVCTIALSLMAVTCDCLPPGTQFACSAHDAAQAAFSADARTGDDIEVHLDMSRVLLLRDAPETMILGNEQLLDISFLDDRTLVLNGLNEGVTNLIAISSDGRVIENRIVRIVSDKGALTTIIRGQSRETFLCGDGCVPVGAGPDPTGN